MSDDRYAGITFPTEVDLKGKYLKLNKAGDTNAQVKSDLIFLLTTPKGSRWKKPDFGCNLTQFLFNQMDEQTYKDIKSEISSAIAKYFQGITIKSMEIKETPENYLVGLRIEIEISSGIFKEQAIVDFNF